MEALLSDYTKDFVWNSRNESQLCVEEVCTNSYYSVNMTVTVKKKKKKFNKNFKLLDLTPLTYPALPIYTRSYSRVGLYSHNQIQSLFTATSGTILATHTKSSPVPETHGPCQNSRDPLVLHDSSRHDSITLYLLPLTPNICSLLCQVHLMLLSLIWLA